MYKNKIQVYLDDADYSTLSNPKILSKDPTKKELKAFLIKYVEMGLIEIRYSFISAMALIHREEDARDFAIERAKLLMQLTQGKVLRNIYSVFTEEIIAVANAIKSNSSINLSYAYAENNEWLEYSEWDDFPRKLRTEIVTACRAEIHKSNGNPPEK